MCRAGVPSCVRGAVFRLSVFSRAIGGLLSFSISRGIVGNGFALPTELHSHRLWQDSNLRPSKEPSHITTGECSTPGFRDSLPPDLSDFLPAPKPIADLETQPSFQRTEMNGQTLALLVPMHRERICDRAPLSADRLPFPGKACSR